ncbi:MAG TPA: adenylate/guanylate cyclase domain-containing protein [Anaerolineales bacterium]
MQTQIEKLRRSIDGLEAQRGVLGDEIVNPALAAARQQLAKLDEQAAAEAAPMEERRLVSILFMDMVGSTSRAEKLDPEEWRQLIQKLHSALGQAVIAHRGEVAQYLGDGLLAFFGAKEAGEDDPENAIRAALDGQSAVAELLSAEKVQVRAGIHSGLVVVGELGEATHKEFTASGDAMNLAARLQSAAPAGGILISHDTYRYVRGVFDLTPRPPLTVKGKSEPIQTYLVRQAKPRPFHSLARGVAGVEAKTVGRDAEIQALQSAYLRAYEGHGVVWVQLVGQPGVGKSRLVAELNDWTDLRPETYRVLRARSFPNDGNQPFALVRRLWLDRFQIADDTSLEQAEAKWVERFKEFSGRDDSDEAAHALGLLVGLPFEKSAYIRAMRNDPVQVKGRALVVSRELIETIRRQSPVVVLLEDLQWMDAASWEYLVEVFLGAVTKDWRQGLFILGTARPEWNPPHELTELFRSSSSEEATTGIWGTQIPLMPISDAATRELAMELFQRAERVPEQIIELMVERAEGVPYYAEEMVNWLIDNGVLETREEPWRFLPERLKQQPLPATLQHLLLTRLSSLPQQERVALQRGAIFGRRFWTGGVEALGLPAGAELLAHLQPRGFVDAQPESAFHGDTEWSFHQSLLQEVTYESVLKRERAALHQVAAGWLERQARQAGRLEEFAGLLGDHYERAGDLSTAADWYLQAGRRAMSQGAPREAKRFYTQALDLLPPVDRERRWRALLGREEALSVLGEPEPRKADLAALLEVSQSLGNENYLAQAHLLQAIFGLQSGEPLAVVGACREALAAARRCGNEAIEAKALAAEAAADSVRNDKSEALHNIEAALQLAHRLGDDGVLAEVLFRAANCFGELGDFASCDALQAEQIELDHRLGNRIQEAKGLGNRASNYLGMGLYKQARPLIEQSRLISEALGAHYALGYNLVNLGAISYATGDLRKARDLFEQALQEFSLTRDARGKGFALTGLGQVLLAMGDAPGAARRFLEGHELASARALTAQASEALIGLAASAILQGQTEEARKYACESWEYLRDHGWTAMGDPGWAYHTCAETFDALADDDSMQAVLEAGHKAFLEVADRINVPSWRQSFLENVPEIRALMAMWERRRRR